MRSLPLKQDEDSECVSVGLGVICFGQVSSIDYLHMTEEEKRDKLKTKLPKVEGRHFVHVLSSFYSQC